MELLEWVENNKKQTKTKITESKYFDLCFVGGVCIISLLAGIIYVLLSKTVYFWDSSTYWDISRTLEAKQINKEFFAEVYNSIGTQDYNYLVAVPVALWMKVFGVTRVSYIASIIVFYLIPSQIIIYLIARKTAKAPKFAFVATLFIIPALWYITCIGFIDIAGVLVGLLCYFLYFTDVLDKRPYIKSVLLGFLLVLVMIIRRYFAFFAVSFVTAMAIDSILFRHNIRQFFVTIFTFGVVLVVLFNPFLNNILLKDYATLYSGYRYSFTTDMKLITRYFGMVFLLLAFLVSIFNSIKHREVRALFALLQIIVCATMFVSTQTHGQQHLLLYVPALAVIVILSVNLIKKEYALIVLCLIAFLNTSSTCIDRVQPQNIQEIKSLAVFPTYSVKPPKRPDINSVLALKKNLDKKIPEGAKCGVLSSSFMLNSSVLINVVPSLNMKEVREDSYIVGLPEVDSRDYWRLNEIYDCEYILVASPAQTHLAPGQQTIITEAVKSFEDRTDIALSFSELRDFNFRIGDITVKLYKRTSDVTETAKTEFQLRLYK